MRFRLSILFLAATFTCSLAGAEYFYTDLVAAAKSSDYHAVHRIIAENPQSVESQDESGYTALHWAGIRGDWRAFKELIAAKSPVNAVGGDGGTPMHWASHHDRADMVKLLLDAGADATVQNRWGRTPLHVAARRGCPNVAKLLLDHGADPNATTKEGWTCLHVASMSGQTKLAQLLQSRGADPDAMDGEGKRPRDLQRQRPSQVAVEASNLGQYTGVYDLGGGATVKVWRDKSGLRIREFAPDGLYPIGPDRFFCVQEPWSVSFERDSSGKVSGIEIQYLRRSVSGSKKLSPRYVGSAACMSCHSDPPRSNPSISWMASRHGHAYWRLGADWALFLAKLRPHYDDLEHPISDDRCLLCHVTGRQNQNAFFEETYREEEGVGCESCHGPGSLYLDPEIMADREAFIANGGIVPDEKTCRSCHRNSEQFNFEEMLPKVAHKRIDEG